jgi:D-arabinose 1-dehydrogenase-like Zn-dependent alcohol dehydrogenase
VNNSIYKRQTELELTDQYKIVCREDYPVPTPGDGELLVELKMTGICQSDHREQQLAASQLAC